MAAEVAKGESGRGVRAQCADAVLMVRPAAFGFNPETAATNSFQRDAAPGGGDPQREALAEFDRMVAALRSEGITVAVAADSTNPAKPDAVFPNNWASFHHDGTLVLYPMANPSRRAERRQAVIDAAIAQTGFAVRHLIDLSWHEGEGRYLEGTGSLVLDHVNRVAYACASPRTHPELVAEWARELDYTSVVFRAANRARVPLYHTNVALCIGAQAAVVALEAIEPADRARVQASLAAGGREVIAIGQDELEAFAGNMLELATWDEALGDARVLVMSDRARHALGPATYARLAACTDTILPVPMPVIETLGGGSVRCMMAEVFRGAA